jgi:cytoskeletal protein RodZ
VLVAQIPRAAPVTVAKVEEPKVEDTVEPATTAATDATENSSISSTDKTDNTAAATTDEVAAKTDTTDEVKTPAKADTKKVATTDPGCKAFFPAIGAALTVPCK